MTKAELIERIARSRDLPADLTKKDISLVLGLAFEELASYFARAKVTRASSPRFSFPHFGTFTKKRRSARRGVNPRTLEPMEIEAFDTVDFKASRELRAALNVGSAPLASRRAKAAGGKSKTGTKASTKTTKRAPKKVAKKVARKARKAPGQGRSIAGRRGLTSRDEAAELATLVGDDELFAPRKARSTASDNGAPLPAARLQRVDASEPEDAPPAARRARSRG